MSTPDVIRCLNDRRIRQVEASAGAADDEAGHEEKDDVMTGHEGEKTLHADVVG